MLAKRTSALLASSVSLLFALQASAAVGTVKFNFDDVAANALPAGWTVMSALTATPTNATPHVVFRVVADATAPGATAGNKVLKLTEHTTPVYDDSNHCWTKAIQFLDGTISADIMASDSKKGHCGFSFRIKDHQNFYGLRYSEIEGNLALFRVKDGVGLPVTGTAVPIEEALKGTNKWVNLKVEVSGATIKAYLNNVLKWSVTDPSPLTGAGGVGAYSRGDVALVSWDNFTITGEGIGR
jgi:hypothetical protein